MPTLSSPAKPTATLADLRDIHLPEPVSAWPPAPGWWFLALAILLALTAVALVCYRRYQARAYRREALKLLQQARNEHLANVRSSIKEEKEHIDLKRIYIENLAKLLKRTALTAYPDATGSQLASLSGQAWVDFLLASCPPLQAQAATNSQSLPAIYQALYSGDPKALEQLDDKAFFQLCRIWISQHRAGWQAEWMPASQSAATGGTHA